MGNYPNNAHGSGGYVGINKLAISKQDSTHGNCLLLADTNNFSPPGFIDSFSIKADGSLSTEVSHLQVANGDPSEVHVVNDTAYVDNPGNDFESYNIGAGCTLTFLSKASQSGLADNFALVGSTELVTPNFGTNSIDAYSLGTNGAITFLASTISPVNSPDGVAVQNVETQSGRVTNIFTGISDFEGVATAQGGQLNRKTGTVSFFTDSPAKIPLELMLSLKSLTALITC